MPLGIGIAKLLMPLLDKVLPDQQKKQEAKIALVEMEQNGEFREQENAMRMIVAEAQSEDKWTSRARPSFLYVVYILLLSSIPFSVLFAFNPEAAKDVVEGFKMWLAAIPDELYTTMTVGYLGYTVSREYGKKEKLKALKTTSND